MTQITRAPFNCHLDTLSVRGADGETNDDLCAFEFPWCEGCLEVWDPRKQRNDDPIKCAVWDGWIKGVVAPD